MGIFGKILNTLSFGIYGAAKGVGEAGAAAADLMDSLVPFIQEITELVTIKRVTPRGESELWEEELNRYKALIDRKTELKDELARYLEKRKEEEGDNFNGNKFNNLNFFDMMWGIKTGFGVFAELKKIDYEELRIRSQISIVDEAINEMLYEEPGVVPQSMYYVKNIIEQFSNTGLPLLEETVDSVNGNLEESRGILQEVKKLFVSEIYEAIPIDSMSPSAIQRVAELEGQKGKYDDLIVTYSKIAVSIQDSAGEITKSIGNVTAFSAVKVASNFRESVERVSKGLSTVTHESSDEGDPESVAFRPVKSAEGISMSQTAISAPISSSIPTALRISSVLMQDEVTAYLSNYSSVQGLVRFYEREKFKVEKEIFRLKVVRKQVPGPIPKTLDEFKEILSRFRSEEQPRIEGIMDNINETITESKNLLANFGRNTQGITGFLSKYKILIGIAVGAIGVLIFGILIMLLIVLTRMAFGI